MAKDKNVNVTLMRRYNKNDLTLLPYNIKNRKYHTHVQHQKRIYREMIIPRELKIGTAEEEIFFFSEEKLLTIEASLNNQNDRVYAKSSTLMSP